MNDLVAIPAEKQAEQHALVSWAQTLTIQTVQERDDAVAKGKAAKALARAITDDFEPSRVAAKAAYDNVLKQRDKYVDPLVQVEKLVKAAQTTFEREEYEKAEKERMRLQAIADKQAQAERERLEREAAKLKTPELAEARREMAAAIVAPVVTVPIIAKAEGTSAAKIWKARVVDPAKVPREWMIVDQKALDAFAKSTKGTKQIEGVEFYPETSQRW